MNSRSLESSTEQASKDVVVTEATTVASAQENSTVPLISETERANFKEPLFEDGAWSEDVTGLALSGGGIRSATISLGILQTFARNHLLRRIDFMSTVSGGGYIGSFLGRFYDRYRDAATNEKTRSSIPDQVEHALVDPDSPMIRWLRIHGNYIAPNGGGDGRLNFAIFIRNLLSVHLVVGIAIFSVFAIANGIRYGLFDHLLAGTSLILPMEHFPIGQLVRSLLGPWFSPWFILVEICLLFLALPRILGYWIVSQDKHEAFKTTPLLLLFLISGLLLYIGVNNGLRVEMVLIGVAMLSSLIQVELAWRRGRKREAAVGTGGVESQRLRTRNYLTYDLGLGVCTRRRRARVCVSRLDCTWVA